MKRLLIACLVATGAFALSAPASADACHPVLCEKLGVCVDESPDFSRFCI